MDSAKLVTTSSARNLTAALQCTQEYKHYGVASQVASRAACLNQQAHQRLHTLASYSHVVCECRLLLVGGGPQEREARRYIATRRLHGVEFLGRVSDDEKAQLFRTADVYVSPATGRESFGIVLLEAMACGVPPVAFGLPGVAAVVEDGRTGLLAPPGDVAALAGKMREMLELPEPDRAALGAAGRAACEARFAWPRVVDRVEAAYAEVVR